MGPNGAFHIFAMCFPYYLLQFGGNTTMQAVERHVVNVIYVNSERLVLIKPMLGETRAHICTVWYTKTYQQH